MEIYQNSYPETTARHWVWDHYSILTRARAEILELRQFLSQGQLPEDPQRAKKIAAQAPSFALLVDIIYFINSKRNNQRCCVVPTHLRAGMMEENHSGPFAGHFSGERLYKALVRHWWWPSMYSDVVSHCTACPQCAVVHSSGRLNRPPLHPIPVQRVCGGSISWTCRELSLEQARGCVPGFSLQVATSVPCP